MAPLTHVLFDFFGTLVAYSESRVDQGFHKSYEVLLATGAQVDYAGFLERWEATVEEFESRAQHNLDEYSMDAVCGEFLQRALGRSAGAEALTNFRNTYLNEWNKGVRYIPGVSELLADLADRFTLVLVTNTHHADLVHGHLRAMGGAQCLAAVVTSVEHGKRKPSRCIFERAVAQSSGTPEISVFVGDSFSADYLGAVTVGLRCLLIDPGHRHDVPEIHRLAHVFETPDRLSRL